MHNWQLLNVTKLHCYIVTFKCLGKVSRQQSAVKQISR